MESNQKAVRMNHAHGFCCRFSEEENHQRSW